MCYAPIALVTDMDAGVEAGEGVGQEEVFAMFARNIDRLKGLLAGVVADLPDAGAAARARRGPTASSCPTRSRAVPREGPAHRLGRLHRRRRSPSSSRRGATRWSGSTC